MVLFTEKIGGLFRRLERPFPVYSRGGKDRFDMWASASPDLRYWGDTALVLAVEQVPWANDKLGPGAPPVKTRKGWLALPIVQKITRLCKEAGIPSHVHSCGPEKALVKIFAEETDLTVVDPLEIPPMGDCDLRELKERYGKKLVLKGNLHTTAVMLRGSVNDVVAASKKAIDDAAEGGGFILSTGDQCGRDTPEENLFAMIETAETYGKY
jgi:hypothetical protein